MRNTRIFISVIVVMGMFIVSGCTPQGDMFAQNIGELAVQQAIVSSVRNDIEGPRGTTVNVFPGTNNVASQGGQQRYYDGEMTGGGYYKGEISDRKPHGMGTYNYSGGSTYVGQFMYGNPNGQGTLTLPSGRKHVGEFKDGNLDGQGTCTFVNGTFVGVCVNNQPHKGTFTGDDGTVMVGVFSNVGTKAGIIDYPDGREYEGEWNGDPEFLGEKGAPGHWSYERPHGIGKMVYPDGKVEEGIWRKGKFLGQLSK